jgi:hypothetical protein
VIATGTTMGPFVELGSCTVIVVAYGLCTAWRFVESTETSEMPV